MFKSVARWKQVQVYGRLMGPKMCDFHGLSCGRQKIRVGTVAYAPVYPEVQFHQTVASAGEDLEQINIKELPGLVEGQGLKELGCGLWPAPSEYESDGLRCVSKHTICTWLCCFCALTMNVSCLGLSPQKDYLTKFCSRRAERWAGEHIEGTCSTGETEE